MRKLLFPMLALLGLLAAPARAESPQALVDRATQSVRSVLGDTNFGAARAGLKRAKAVLIVPELVKAGLIVGGEGGDGVLLVKDASGAWSDPAFYMLASGSIGLQAGVEKKEVLFLIMTDLGLEKVMTNQMKLGADASITVGTVGAGAEASTVGSAKADIVAYSKGMGLFGGGALEGGVISPKNDWNAAYYGAGAGPRGITLERRFSNPDAVRLKQALSAY